MEDTLRNQFIEFCHFGTGAVAKTTLTDKNLTKMFKDAKLYGKNLTTTDTDICFNKVKDKGKKDITYEQFTALLKEVAVKYGKDHKIFNADEAYMAMSRAIIACGPSLTGTTGVSKTGAVDRMTDHTQYTGAHKQRFDADGRGKGLDGRENRVSNDGYVGNYKGAGTYDAKH